MEWLPSATEDVVEDVSPVGAASGALRRSAPKRKVPRVRDPSRCHGALDDRRGPLVRSLPPQCTGRGDLREYAEDRATAVGMPSTIRMLIHGANGSFDRWQINQCDSGLETCRLLALGLLCATDPSVVPLALWKPHKGREQLVIQSNITSEVSTTVRTTAAPALVRVRGALTLTLTLTPTLTLTLTLTRHL